MNAASFFTNSKTVWVSENFQNIFLTVYEYTENRPQESSLLSSDLQHVQSETGIEKMIFQNTDSFLEQLAVLIQDQANGENGKLLNDSSANYFFVQGKDNKHYSILVRWEQAQKLWRCGAYLQENLKMPNIRIFYPA